MPDASSTFQHLPILQELRDDLSDAFHASEQRACVTVPAGRQRRRRRLTVARTAAGAAVVVLAAIALTMATQSPRSGSVRASRPPSPSPASPRIATGATIRLASYRFHLPGGYSSVDERCAAGPAPSGESFAAAQSADGGCVEAELVAGSVTIPSDARAIRVGPFQGYLSTATSENVDLFIDIPAGTGPRDLVLVTHGLTAQQVVSIAKAGLPASIGPIQTCTANCG